jgi:hypothetical protein
MLIYSSVLKSISEWKIHLKTCFRVNQIEMKIQFIKNWSLKISKIIIHNKISPLWNSEYQLIYS